MAKFVFVLAFVLAVGIVEKASAAPTFCTFHDGAWVCDFDTDPDGPA